jgi:cation diffusion facilitator family transporter
MSADGSPKAVIAALAANLGIAAIKFGAWILTGASSMLAEAVHSVADSGNQCLLLLGGSRSARGPTSKHPFGYGRERYLAAFVVSIVLFTLGGLFALYEAYHKYHEVAAGHRNELLDSRWWWVALAVLGAAIVMESLSFRTAIVEARPLLHGLSWIQFIRQTRSPELPVILLEDFAALVGLVLALGGISLTLATGSGYWDAAGTAAIGVLLGAVAVVLGIETRSLLLGESATPANVATIEDALADDDSVLSVIDLRTLHLGPEELLVATKIAVKPTDSAAEVADAINRAEARIRAALPSARHIYIEPDLRIGPDLRG